ncbi:hypothetical protein [Arthrobacter woluwensis]|uniref:hypothetical protein n=1 Tax=Arthrobacter woluwensis TaxID=156980 RepID=UPI0011A90C65|nr:hypothetical protein [Arthrobacter woluwensis]
MESGQTSTAIFAAQKKQIQDQRPGAVFHESLSGIGPKEINVPAVPKGTTMIGAAINCDEGGNWNLSVSQKTPARSQAQCSLGVTPAIEFPIDNKLGENKLVLEVNKDSHFWISIYYK